VQELMVELDQHRLCVTTQRRWKQHCRTQSLLINLSSAGGCGA